tara:strand:- start:373 stop:1305 length:933 start_codon:yes stop_codon:yes gene_type:complete
MASKLKVDNIQDTGSNNILTSDGSGNVTLNTTLGNFTSTGIDDNADATAVTIDSSENVFIGKTSSGIGTVGAEFTAVSGGISSITRDNGTPFQINRKTSNGSLLTFLKDGTVAGSINVGDHDLIIGKTDGDVQCYLRFAYSNQKIIPCTDGGNTNDNLLDLGASESRFDDIHATNGTIQTSDQNEKQSIQALTSTEIAVAKRISKLFKTFKWNSAVEEKGDNARTHTGIIAQDVQQAFTDEGLDSSNYGLFISSTWWENEEGDIKEEATEGYTERTRLGIRYPELLSFISSAFEQRLTDIETRVEALENA